MKAMLLAAGLGKRLRPLTETTPKPLLRAGSKRLIEYQIENLVVAGITEIVINLHHLADQRQRGQAPRPTPPHPTPPRPTPPRPTPAQPSPYRL